MAVSNGNTGTKVELRVDLPQRSPEPAAQTETEEVKIQEQLNKKRLLILKKLKEDVKLNAGGKEWQAHKKDCEKIGCKPCPNPLCKVGVKQYP